MSADAPLYYWDYLHLDDVLGAQRPESARRGEVAHDEMLFIVVHQAFELWFKQILWELDDAVEVLGRDRVDEADVGTVVDRLERIRAIQPLLLQQIDVLETMTPMDFLEFRDMLVPASGFQSVQFRLIENRLGLDPDRRLKIKGAPYHSRLSDEHADLLRRAEEETTLLGALDAWLARTPFLELGDFDFWSAYRRAVERSLARDRQLIERNPSIDDTVREQQLDAFEQTAASFETLFDAERYERLRAAGRRRLSQRAFLAALFVSLYRDAPILQAPLRLLTALIDIDEGFTAWRHRHALLAQRMIGGRIGTGGTAGFDYLRAAAERHKAFPDLVELPTFLLPRSERPDLPAEVRDQMAFAWGGGA